MNKYAILLLLTPLTTIAEDKPKPEGENFYREARLGDWVESKGVDVVFKHTVVARTDKELRIKIEQTIAGKVGPAFEHTVDLTIPYPPPPSKKPNYTHKQEKLETGKETLTIGGKKYECEWDRTRSTVVTIFMDKETTNVSTSKIWRCKDVPLGMPVRVETELHGGGKTESQIIDFGRGK